MEIFPCYSDNFFFTSFLILPLWSNSQALPQHWGVHSLWSTDHQWDQGGWRSQGQLLSGGHLLPWRYDKWHINVTQICFLREIWKREQNRDKQGIQEYIKVQCWNPIMSIQRLAVRSEAKPKFILASQNPDSFMQLRSFLFIWRPPKKDLGFKSCSYNFRLLVEIHIHSDWRQRRFTQHGLLFLPLLTTVLFSPTRYP